MIEEKLSRLTSEQRREVEDFIDFLMTRDSIPKQQNLPGSSGSFSEINDFPDSGKDTLFGSSHETSGNSGDDILADYPEYGDMGGSSGTSESNPVRSVHYTTPVARKTNSRDPSQLLDWLD